MPVFLRIPMPIYHIKIPVYREVSYGFERDLFGGRERFRTADREEPQFHEWQFRNFSAYRKAISSELEKEQPLPGDNIKPTQDITVSSQNHQQGVINCFVATTDTARSHPIILTIGGGIHLYPASYFQLRTVAHPDATPMTLESTKELAIKMLQDYTKKSGFELFFTGHWNRHHRTTAIQLMTQIDQCTDKQAFYDLLQTTRQTFYADPKNNPEGSFARRLDFMLSSLIESDYRLLQQQDPSSSLKMT